MSFDDRYFPYDPYQALPTNDYTTFIKNMLTHKNIHVSLETDYFELKSVLSFTPNVTIYTGPVDHCFGNSGLPNTLKEVQAIWTFAEDMKDF